jgi:hypothetical protein
MAERFAAAGLYHNAVEISGHRFVRTNFKVVRTGGERAIHYCPCGQIALENNGDMDALDNQGAECELAPCRYFGGRKLQR